MILPKDVTKLLAIMAHTL